LNLGHLRQPLKAPAARPLLYGILAGIFLGLYLISWLGALLFVFVIVAYFLVQFTVDHLQKRSPDYLCLTGTAVILPALLIFVLVSDSKLVSASLVIALLAPAALTALSRLLSSRQLTPALYPLALAALGGAAVGMLYAVDSGLFRSMIDQMAIFSWHTGTTNLEMQPLLFPSGEFSFQVVWGNFTTGSFLSLISLALMIYMIVKNRGESDKTLVVVWTLVILAATLAQRRFNYYLAINVALLTSYVSRQVLRAFALLGGPEQPAPRPQPVLKKKSKARSAPAPARPFQAKWAWVSLAVIVVFFGVLYPNISKARQTAGQTRFAPSDAWVRSLSWLRENTPEPFGSADFYYNRYTTPFEYPDTAYGVTAWWDYGYWIVRTAHRIPSQNPGGPVPLAVSLFVAQDESAAGQVMADLGSRYLITDYQIVTGKFHAPVTLSGLDLEDFQGVFYYRETEGSAALTPVMIYFPEYYRSMAVRLHTFGGQAVVPQSVMAITWEWRTSTEGIRYREITKTQSFPTYEEAAAFVEEESGNWLVGSPNAFTTPVPLEELEHFVLRHAEGDIGGVPEVRVFEYTG
jgi:dolichyl-diphosphooligosaccharide--protein glycosyltransferase